MSLRLALLLVRLASRAVPADRRADFVREWEAELRRAAMAGSGDVGGRPLGGPDAAGSAKDRRDPGLLRHAGGAFADAMALREIHGNGRTAMERWLDGWTRDGRQAVRGLLRSPGFSAIAVFTLALGLGGSAALFTVLDRVVLDPLPHPEPERLVRLENLVPGVGEGTTWGMSTAQQVHLEDRATTLDATGLYRALGATLLTAEGPARVYGWRATVEVLPLLGARPLLGRIFDQEDLRPDAPPRVILSHGFWQRHFAADRDVLGRSLVIDDQPHAVVGVLEPGLSVPGAPRLLAGDVWVPLPIDRNGPFWNSHVYVGIGRLAFGVEAEDAEAEIARLWRELPERFPDAYGGNFLEGSGMRTRAVPMAEAVVGPMARNLWILFGAVGVVLLIAWANVSNLFLVRVEARRRELDIRSALGAGRAAIARYLLAEALVLSLAGGLLALLVCVEGVPALVRLAPEALPRSFEIAVGAETILYTMGLALVAGLGLALYPLLRYSGEPGSGALAGGARPGAAGPRRQRLRSALVVSQVALALTLVVGAGLFVESLRRLGELDPGVDAEGLLTAALYLSPARYADDRAVWSALDRMVEEVEALPGVTAAAMVGELPVEGGFLCTVQGFADPAVRAHLDQIGLSNCAGQVVVTPGYFETAGIPVLQGRAFTRTDNDDPSVGAVVVSRAFAERFWPGQDPIGRGVAPSGRTIPPFYRVVGVVGDVPAGSLEAEPAIAIYYPVRALPDVPGDWGRLSPLSLNLVVRAEGGDPLALVPGVRRAVQAVDPDVPVTEARTMERIIADSTARYTFTSLLMAIAAAVALLLAAVGLYGVVSWIVARRTREIGTRIAMGARPGEVERMFLLRSAGLVSAGLLLGAVVALATTRLLESLLFGVEPTHPGTFTVASLVLAAVALVATWIPARRAARVDPSVALRVE